MADRPLLFYSAWPLGYHNPEAERKALALADDGWDVTYVRGAGIRNPRPQTLDKALRLVAGRARSGPSRRTSGGLRQASLLVVPPRQLSPVRRVNARWVESQLRRIISDWPRALVWVRRPTPELNDALERLRPAGIVYECVDAYHHTPGMTGRWAERHDTAERELVRLADAAVTPNELLADYLRARGAKVTVVPHGVELFDWRPPRPREERMRDAVIGFVGTLDCRLDVPVVRHVARAHPGWRLRLIGPQQDGFESSSVDDLPNVSVEPPVPHERLGDVLADFDAGIMPYVDDEVFRFMTPLKNLELMAAGRPAVARPSPNLRKYEHVLAFASTPEEFSAELDRVLAEESVERARCRRALAEQEGWAPRLEEVRRIARRVVGDQR